jgi:hypothetical protein
MSEIPSWTGARVGDRTAQFVGVVCDVYYDEASSRPAWLLVSLADAPERLVLVPAEGAVSWSGSVVVPFEHELIAGSPTVANPPALLAGEPVCRLARHYGVRIDRHAAYAAVHGGAGRVVRAA